MGIFRQFPYSNFHDMNMDELIKIVRQLFDEWATYHATWEDWKNGVDATINSFYNWFNTLDVQEEINKKLDSMKRSGELATIISPMLPTIVTGWLAEHITEPVGVVIDNSLTIEGAAADAKAAGDRLEAIELIEPFNLISEQYSITGDEAGYVNIENGGIYTTAPDAHNSGKIAITDNIDKLVVKDTFLYAYDGICFYDENEGFICGYNHADFDNETYLVIDLPVGAKYFNVTWWTSKPDPEVWDYAKAIEEYHYDHDYVTFDNVVNEFITYSDNAFIRWYGNDTNNYRTSEGYWEIVTPTSGNRGFRSKEFIPDSTDIFIKLSFSAPDSSNVKLYLYGTSKTNVPDTLWNLSTIVNKGTHTIYIDFNYVDVYSNIDLTKPFSILVSNNTNTGATITVTNFQVGHYKTPISQIVGTDLPDTLEKIEARLNANYYEVADFMVDIDGTKVAQQLVNGSVVDIPVIPDKVAIIGNSLLTGFNATYGINTNPYGMAASDKYHDYYYLVTDFIHDLNNSAVFSKYRSSWEETTNSATYRTYTDQILNNIDSDCDLVIVQLGDNINTSAKQLIFPDNAKALLMEIRNKAQHARVAWCGSWFNAELINDVMPGICKATGTIFIPISDLVSSDTKNIIGGVYYDDNHDPHYIESRGVASHPNDLGFKYIAQRMLYILGISDKEDIL